MDIYSLFCIVYSNIDRNMKVAVFQMDIAWESPCDNREKIERWIEQEAKDADMVILPEMFTTGFTMSPEKVAENAGGESV